MDPHLLRVWQAMECNQPGTTRYTLYQLGIIYLPLSSTASSSLLHTVCESGSHPSMCGVSHLTHQLFVSTLYASLRALIYISLSTAVTHTHPHSYFPQENTPNLGSLVMLFGDNTNPSQPPSTSTHFQPPSTSTHSHLPPITNSLPAIILAADDTTATMLPPLCPPTDIDSATQSSDFLDLLDNGEGACSSKQWMPTPDRPRMFPRKLY